MTLQSIIVFDVDSSTRFGHVRAETKGKGDSLSGRTVPLLSHHETSPCLLRHLPERAAGCRNSVG